MESPSQDSKLAEESNVAVSPIVASPTASSPSISSTAPKNRLSAPPPGFKFLKVRAKDGTIRTVKRPLSPDEFAANPIEFANNETKPVAQSNAHASDDKAKEIAVQDKPAKNIVSNETRIKDISGKETTVSDASETLQQTSGKMVDSQVNELSNSLNLNEALDEQKTRFRKNRMREFRNKLSAGLAGIVGATIPAVDLDIPREGDEFVDDDDDTSDLEDESNFQSDGHNESNGHVGIETGGMAKAAALAMASKEEKLPTTSIRAVGNGGTEKSTYGLTIKKLEDIEAQQETDANKGPLRRRWATFTFYFIASLAILLPGVFFALAVTIFFMDGQHPYSHWHRMEEAIKVAISAWPIVFAAIIAQAFKTYATWQVETGIKLIHLEQLVGSNSFASSLKQPLLLRRINLLALLIFLFWCLSPLGGQALLRCYTTYTPLDDTTVDVSYVNSYGDHPLLNKSIQDTWGLNGTRVQLIRYYYNAAFLPVNQQQEQTDPANQFDDLDFHGNLLIPTAEERPENVYLDDYSAAYGIPFAHDSFVDAFDSSPGILDVSSAVSNKTLQYLANTNPSLNNTFTFAINSSYFKMACQPWKQVFGADLLANMAFYPPSLGISMIDPNQNLQRPNYIALASWIRTIVPINETDASIPAGIDNLPYSFIECTYDRVKMEVNYTCARAGSWSGGEPAPSCNITGSRSIEQDKAWSQAGLADFSIDWQDSMDLTATNRTLSGTEMTLLGGYTFYDPAFDIADYPMYNLTNYTSVEQFEWYFGYVFNTWVNLAYCPECVDLGETDYDLPPELERFYVNCTLQPPLNGKITAGKLYIVNHLWASLFLVTTVSLLLMGAATIFLESLTIAPDTLGYVSTAARNSKYLHLPPYSSQMTGPQRAQKVGGVVVQMQDIRGTADVGRIVLGNKHEGAIPLKPGRYYR